MFAKQVDREMIWFMIKVKFTPQELETIAEEEFADLINGIIEKQITSQVQLITDECEFQVRDSKEKAHREISHLRMQIANKLEEIE